MDYATVLESLEARLYAAEARIVRLERVLGPVASARSALDDALAKLGAAVAERQGRDGGA